MPITPSTPFVAPPAAPASAALALPAIAPGAAAAKPGAFARALDQARSAEGRDARAPSAADAGDKTTDAERRSEAARHASARARRADQARGSRAAGTADAADGAARSTATDATAVPESEGDAHASAENATTDAAPTDGTLLVGALPVTPAAAQAALRTAGDAPATDAADAATDARGDGADASLARAADALASGTGAARGAGGRTSGQAAERGERALNGAGHDALTADDAGGPARGRRAAAGDADDPADAAAALAGTAEPGPRAVTTFDAASASFGAALAAAQERAPTATLAGAHGPHDAPAPLQQNVPTAVDDPRFAAQLGGQIAILARDGVQHARLHLNPAELGPIALQVSVEGQAAHVHLAVDHAHTRNVLEQALPALAAALREQGLQLAGGGVFQQPRQSPQSGQGGDGENRSRAAEPAAPGGADTVDAPQPQPAVRTRTRGMLDLYA